MAENSSITSDWFSSRSAMMASLALTRLAVSAAEIVDSELGRVDDDVCSSPKPGQALTFSCDRNVEITISRQCMRPASLAESTHQHLIGTIEKDHSHIVAVRFERRECRFGPTQEGAGAHVDPQTYSPKLAFPVRQREEIWGQCRWKVVHAEEARVLQNPQRRAAPRTREPGDHDDLRRRAHDDGSELGFSRSPINVSMNLLAPWWPAAFRM